MVMVGRRRELALVDRLLDRAEAGTGGLLVVSGAPGAGVTTFLDAAAERARHRGLAVVREPNAHPFEDLDPVAPGITRSGPALIVMDDLGDTGPRDLRQRLAARAASGPTAILVRAPLGHGSDLHLGGLSEADLGVLLGQLPEGTVHAIWLASGGLPGPALGLAADLTGVDESEAFVRLALTAPSRTAFLDVDAGLVRLLEATADRPLPAGTRARVLARLARELLGDSSASDRRRHLVDEALARARADGDPVTIATVLDDRLHALWDPAAAGERLSAADEIVRQARSGGDGDLERRGLFWSFIAHVELGDLASAESALMRYGRAATLAGDREGEVVVLARQAMLAVVRGRFATATSLAAEVAERGRQAGMADTERLVATIHTQVTLLRGPFADPADQADQLQALARQLPGHFFEATAARILIESGLEVEAGLELQRLLPAVLTGSGPRWLGAVADLAVVAARVGEPGEASALFEVLLPYRGQLVVWGGANTITGPADDYLGRLAVRLDRLDDATVFLNDAVAMEERIGALPWLARTLLVRARIGSSGAAERDVDRATTIGRRLGLTLPTSVTPPREPDGWALIRDGEDWRLDAGPETVRLRDRRGLHYLRTLLAAPGQEIPALDVVAGGAGLQTHDEMPALDAVARAAYQRRLSELDRQLGAADRGGDAERAAAAGAERSALLAELRRATGLGGRTRVISGEAERARVNATRALRAAVEQIESGAPTAAAHLRSSLRTGRLLRYQPAPGGPARWRL